MEDEGTKKERNRQSREPRNLNADERLKKQGSKTTSIIYVETYNGRCLIKSRATEELPYIPF